MTPERRVRLIRLARIRGDKAALAILEASQPWQPTDDSYQMLKPWAGLRWSTAA